jgi:crotonobetainyl-CoA:carnitine CoA-transferase CaiB-like acyl-CoA transferase
LKAYGLDYESLQAENPRLIYCSITGFGQTGPYAKRAGYDFMIQGLGGLMSLTGRPEGEDGAGPVKVGVALTDILTGLYSTSAILAALAHRDQGGSGQHIDMALLDVQVACLANQAMNYLTTGVAPRRLGNAHPNIVPYQDFPTADGGFILTVGNDSQFRKFAQVAGQPQWAEDPRFSSNKQRVAHRAELIPLIRQATVFKTTAEWVTALESAGVPCGPINDVAQVFADPQVQARGLAISLPHALSGVVPQVASPIRLSETPVEYRRAPPMLGEHTREVLTRVLGMTDEAIIALRAAAVL